MMMTVLTNIRGTVRILMVSYWGLLDVKGRIRTDLDIMSVYWISS